MRRLHKNSSEISNLENSGVSRDQHTKFVLKLLRFSEGFVVVFMVLNVLSIMFVVYKHIAVNSIWTEVDHVKVVDVCSPTGEENETNQHSSSIKQNEKQLNNGLFSSQFDKDSCLSRQQVSSYRKKSPYKPSSYLISKLRRYEALHKRCGPYTESYNQTVSKLTSGNKTKEGSGCNYLVWLWSDGLGNRMLSLGSTFLYALLTDRVLLVDRRVDLDDLFCEPFPETSWLLPLEFPLIDKFYSFDKLSPQLFGNMLKLSSNNSSTKASSMYVYVYLRHDYDYDDKLFFCDQDQTFLQNVSWVIMKSNLYFVPSLFLMPSFEQELHSLFPEIETVFHFLGNYLFSPTNTVWGLITRYYNSYLAQANERIGIQVRVFDHNKVTNIFQRTLEMILNCSLNNNLLPQINVNESSIISPTTQTYKAVLITSLSSDFYDKIRDMYTEHGTLTGEVIQVFQPSNEEYQQFENKIHDRKALSEIYLLSFSDKLITSSWSTFGYVAQSLGGLYPWILYLPENGSTPNPSCTRAMSIEPCFHFPPYFDCQNKTSIDMSTIVPHVRHCEDLSIGLKLVNPTVET